MGKFFYNPGKYIDSFMANGIRVTLPDERITEVDASISDILMKEFPYLQLVDENSDRVLPPDVEPTVESRMEDTFRKHEDEEKERFVCSACDALREFDTKQGLNRHIKYAHES